MRNGVVVNLNRRLVVFWDENRLGVGGAVAVGIQNLTNPNVVVVVSVFDGLGGCPRFGGGIPFLLGNFRETVAVVPSVEFAVGGIGFG